MEPEGTLPLSQGSATGPYPDQDESNWRPTSLRSIFMYSSHLRLGLPNDVFPSNSKIIILYACLNSPMPRPSQPS
jgi:hypothetical protein